MRDRVSRAVRWALLGAVPGVTMVLIAQFLLDGEMQLTLGAPGIWLAVMGAVVGFAFGVRPMRSTSG